MVEEDGNPREDNCLAEDGTAFPLFKYIRIQSSTSCFVYFAFLVFDIVIFAHLTNESNDP